MHIFNRNTKKILKKKNITNNWIDGIFSKQDGKKIVIFVFSFSKMLILDEKLEV